MLCHRKNASDFYFTIFYFIFLYFALFHQGIKAIYEGDTNISLICTKNRNKSKGKIRVVT